MEVFLIGLALITIPAIFGKPNIRYEKETSVERYAFSTKATRLGSFVHANTRNVSTNC